MPPKMNKKHKAEAAPASGHNRTCDRCHQKYFVTAEQANAPLSEFDGLCPKCIPRSATELDRERNRRSVEPKQDPAPAPIGQHTPGPWQYEGSMNGKDLTIARVFDDKSKTELALNGGIGYVATVHTWETGYCIKGTQAEANAALIAQAPQLLAENKTLKAQVQQLREALRAALDSAEYYGADEAQEPWLIQARTALANSQEVA